MDSRQPPVKTRRIYSKTCVKQPPYKRSKNVFQDQLLLNAGQKYFRMHSAILMTFIKLPVVIKTYVWPFYTGTYCTLKPWYSENSFY